MKSKSILCLALALSGLVATVAFSQTNNGSNLTPQEIVKKTLDAYAALSSYSDIHYVCEGFTNVFTIPAGYSISQYGLVDHAESNHPRPSQ